MSRKHTTKKDHRRVYKSFGDNVRIPEVRSPCIDCAAYEDCRKNRLFFVCPEFQNWKMRSEIKKW
jgi:hypothetical protein